MKSEEEQIEEVQSFTVAGLSLNRAISPNDVRWAVEEGFKAGKQFAIKSKEVGK